MKVDHVLILAAGKGARMGEIGKVLPKVIWPVFEKSLLEIQVLYAKKIAPQAQIFINIFNHKDCIYKHILDNEKSFDAVKVVFENETLDIGGAIHNLARQLGYVGNLLILNSDQFLYTDEQMILESLSKLEIFDSLLFSYEVNPKDGYNGLECDKNILKSIVPNKLLQDKENIITYSGMCLINLFRLDKRVGESKFFDSVANPLKNKIYVKKLISFEYWDFGTLKRYLDSMFKIIQKINQKDSQFIRFLISIGALNENLVFQNGYDAENKILLKNLEIQSYKIKYTLPDNLIEERVYVDEFKDC